MPNEQDKTTFEVESSVVKIKGKKYLLVLIEIGDEDIETGPTIMVNWNK